MTAGQQSDTITIGTVSMSTSIFRNKNLVRPKKKGAAKRQRLKQQKRRLMSLGVSEDAADKLTTKEIRTLLKRPKKVEKLYAES
jgi:hypothetical protein